MEKKKWIAIIILMIISIVIPLGIMAEGEQAQSTQEDITMEAKIGFDGHYRLGAWTPITVEIENLSQDIDGYIEVIVNHDSDTAISYTRPAVIAKDSKKRFVLHAQINTIQKQLKIDLKQGDRTIKSLEVKNLAPMTLNKYLIGVITDDKPALSYWWRTLGEGSIFSSHDTVQVKTDEIPDNILVMDNFTMIVINNVDTSMLTHKQLLVLDQWVNNGGILIIGTGPNATKTLSGFTPTIIDAQIGEIYQTEPIPDMDNIELNMARLSPVDGKKFMDENGQGIVWMLQKGKGMIFLSEFDLGLEPFISWQGNKSLWETILVNSLNADVVTALRDPNIALDINVNHHYGSNYQLREALGAIKALDLPSFTNLIIILLGYLLVVGPINYIILKKFDKREWAWFTIPALVILFSIGIYAMGYWQKGSEIIVNTVSTIRLNDNAKADIDTYAGIFIPRRGDYEVSVDGDSFLSLFGEGGFDDMHYPNAQEQHQKRVLARISQVNPSSITLYDSNVWTMRTFTFRELDTAFGDIKGELFYEDGKVRGTVTNNTPYPLEDVIIYTPFGSFESIGNIVSGGQKEVNLSISNVNRQYKGYDSLYMMLENLYPYSYYSGRAPSDEEREIWIKRNLIEGILMNYANPSLTSSSYINLLGFCEYRPDEKIKVNGTEPSDLQYRGVVIKGLDMEFEKDGVVSIPPGYVKGILDVQASDSVFPEYSGFYLERGQAVFYFDMSSYMDLDISKFEIIVTPYNGSIGLSIYDIELGDYIDVGDNITNDRARGTISINPNDLNGFVSENGLLYLRVHGEPRGYTNFETPTLVIEGRQR